MIETYQGLPQDELERRISSAKEKLGRELAILGHHYQREDVIKFADFRGDSFGLSKIASEQKSAKYIVFCGVHFMAEAAKILAKPNQRIFMPDTTAGCPMADMASIDDVETAWEKLAEVYDTKKIMPIVYMNSVSAIKAFCGRNNGFVCTSGNAKRAFDYALDNAERIFFFPDEHLGRNTAREKGISKDEILLWDYNNPPLPPFRKGGEIKLPPLKKGGWGGFKAILWKGFCHVHTFFTVEHVKEARKNFPGCKIVVHPECKEDVVIACDEAASTEGILRYVADQKDGATIVIGTEINLVTRVAKENPNKKIYPLAKSLCPNMLKISPADLCFVLEGILDGAFSNEILVEEGIKQDARVALNKMLLI